MKRSWLLYTVLLWLNFPMLLSCEHRPLVEIGNTHYVRIYLDEKIPNITQGFYDENLPHPEYGRPKIMRVMLCDRVSGRKVAERYLQRPGVDEKGYYLDGYIIAPPGDYDLMAYNFGTETTLLSEENNYRLVTAYTNPVSPIYYDKIPSATKRENINGNDDIVYCPDHLFVVTGERIHLPLKAVADSIKDSNGDYFRAKTVVESYYIQVRISGIQWVRSSVGLLSGISRTRNLSSGEIDRSAPGRVFFEMADKDRGTLSESDSKTKGQTAVIYATFNTFGRIPDMESILDVNFEFVKTDGGTQVETLDITPLFDTPECRNNRWLIIDKEIQIQPPKEGGGGFAPGVDDWDDSDADITI